MPRILIAVGVAALACSSLSAQAPALQPEAPWFDGLGRHAREISTENDGAQGYFNQGLAFLAGANPDEARRSFEEAARFDPRCAMAYWGLAMSQGPQLELPPPGAERELAAVAALNRAHELAAKRALPVERELIAALARRHSDPPPDDRRPLDRAYAGAMREVWQRYPQDPDVGAWYAAAVLQAAGRPRWTPDGLPDETTGEVLDAVQQVLELAPKHPLANRLAVLVMAGSPRAARAEPQARVLRELAPGLGHFIYTAGRIDARLGRWESALEATAQALAADKRYLELGGMTPNRYRLTMSLHRLGAVYVAMMTGRSAMAQEKADALVKGLPAEWRQNNRRAADRLLALPVQVDLRFGRWKAILERPMIPAEFPLSRSLQHAARGLARIALEDVDGARAELEAIMSTAAPLSADPGVWGEGAELIIAVAAHLLTGEILLHENDTVAAITALEYAVHAAEALQGTHGSFWLLPPRHALGSALIAARDLPRAAEVFSADLEKWPENGWSLLGLSQVRQLQEDTVGAEDLARRFARAWAHADRPIDRPWMPQAIPEQAPEIASK